MLLFNGGYGRGGFVFGTSGNVDLCIVLVENSGEFFADAA